MASKKKKLDIISVDQHNRNKLNIVNSLDEYNTNKRKQEQERLNQYLAYKKREQEQKAIRNTDIIRNMAISDQNNTGSTFNAYQAKQWVDTHGGASKGAWDALREKNRQELNDRVSANTKTIRNMSVSDQNNNGNNFQTYQDKQWVDTHGGASKGAWTDLLKKRIQEEQEQRDQNKFTWEGYNDYLNKNKTQLEGQKNKYGNKLSPLETQLKWQAQAQDAIKRGVYDNGNDPYLMSDEGLKLYNIKLTNRINSANNRIRELNEEKAERDNWTPDNAKQGLEYLYDDMRSGSYTDGTDALYFTNVGRDIVQTQGDSFYNNKSQYLSDDQERNREALFNHVFGINNDQAYDQATEDMTAEQKARFDEQLDYILEDMNNPYNAEEYYTGELAKAEQEKQQAERLLKQERDITQDRNRVRALEMNAPELDESKRPTGEYKTYDNNPLRTMFSQAQAQNAGDDMDRAYWDIKNQQSDWNKMTWEQKREMLDRLGAGSLYGNGLADTLQDTRDAYKQYYAFMTPEQVDVFDAYYLSGDKESARAYLDGLSSYLMQSRKIFTEQNVREAAKGEYGGVYGIGSVLAAPMNGLVGGIGTAAALLGDKNAQNAASDYYLGQNNANAIREERSNVWGEAAAKTLGEWSREPAKFLNNVFYSMADNMMAMGVASGFGMANKVSTGLVQFIMSSEAATSTMNEKLEQGMDPTEAALYAVGNGVIEAITEKYSLEALLKPDVKEMIGNWKQIAKFNTKNFLAESSEEGASDVLNMGLDWMLSMLNGHENELQAQYRQLLDSGMSEKEASRQVFMDKLEQIGVSMLAGGISGMFMSGGRVAINAISQAQQGQNIKASEIDGIKGGDALLKLAKDMQTGELSFEQYEELMKKQEAGEEISDRELGRLAQTMQVEAQETLKNPESTKEQIAKSISTLQSVAEIANATRKKSRTGGLHMASQEEIEQAEGERTGSSREALLFDQNTGKSAFANIKDVQITKKDGKWDVKLQVTVNGESRTVNPNEIKSTNYKTSQIITQAAVNPEFYSAGFTNLLLDAAENGQISDNDNDIEKTLKDAKLVRLYAYAGFLRDNMPQTSISRQLMERIWTQSVEEHGANRKTQVADANRKQTGTARFEGAEIGTEAWNEKLSKLDPQTRDWMETIGGIAQRAGIEADFRNLKDDDKTYGWENDQGIGLNINGWNYERDENGKVKRSGTKHNMMVTFGHEMTHWLQRNSMQGYNRLEQYVLQNYINDQGADEVMRRLNRHMFGSEKLSLEDAISEVVADSCDQILSNESVRDHIAQTDSKLFGQIKGFVKNLVDRFKKAILGMDESASVDARAMAGRMNEIAKIWLGAYDEALSGYIEQKTSNKSGIERYALSPYTDAELMNWRRSNTIIVYNGKEEMLDRFIDRNLDDPTRFEKMYFGKIDPVLATRIRNETGIETEGLNLTLRSSELYKIMVNDHGNYTYETNRGQTPVTATEILEAVKAIEEPDKIEKGSYDGQGAHHDAITFIKNINGRVVAYTFVARKKHDLVMQTIYKNITKEDVAPEGDANTSPQTSKTSRGTAFDKRISQNNNDGNINKSQAKMDNENEGFSAESMVDDIDSMETEGNPSSKIIGDASEIVKLDAEYQDAVERGDLKKATEMLMEKLRKTEGVIPVMAAEWDTGEYRETAKKLKTGDPEAIEKAAKEMAKYVPDNAVLIPMPGREGKLTDDSWTVKLANAISEITGRPVVTALEGVERGSRQEAKSQGEEGASQEELGFRQVEEIPDGAFPIFVDNVVGKGITADAARQAMGGGITLAYTKTLRSPGIKGLKNAVVTYESKSKGGGLIPLSKRFDVSKRDVRYSQAQLEDAYDEARENGNNKTRFSMAMPVEQTRNLIAVHNLTEQNLIDTLREGGFTAPSIAVIRAATGHSKFGEISVVFNKDTIDPRKSAKNKVYGTDAWTPTRSNAQIETKLDYDKMMAAQRHVEDIMEGVQPELAHEASRWINEKAYHEDTTKTIDDWVLEGLGNEGLLAAYMTERGMEIPIRYRQVKNNSDLHEENEEMYKEFLNDLERHGMLDSFMREMGEASADYNLEKWGNLFAQVGDESHKSLVNNALEKGGMAKRVAARRLAQVWMYEQAGRKIETHDEFDKYATRQAMQDVIDRNDFEKWMKDLVGGAFGERGVYNGVDPYDSMGNRRSWKRTHMAPTAENIVKAMYRNHDAKGGEAGRATGLMAKASKEYRNISEIRADQGRLQMMQDEEYSKLVENLDNELSDFWNELSETNELGTYSISGIMIDAAETYAKTGSISAFAAKMKKEGITLTQAQLETAKKLMDEAREIPTGYFEAKPERVVGLEEIEKVILPDNTSDELLRMLDENDVSYEFYNGTDEDRLEKLNEQENARFSRWTEEAMDVNLWMKDATASSVQTEDERILLDAYRGLRIKLDLSTKKIVDYQARIRKLENRQKQAELNAEERKELVEVRKRLDAEEQKHAKLEDEMFRVTSADGYARAMYQHNMVFKDYIQGKTHDQVRQTVENMLKQVQKAQAQMEKDTEELKKLSQEQAVKTMKSYLGKSSISQMSSMLRKNYNSTMSKSEIEARLAEMALKMANGEDITSESELLARDLVDRMRGIRSENLENVKGTTLVIGKKLLAELKAENLTMNDLRSQLKGSGVKIKTDEKSTFRSTWQEMRENNGALPDLDEENSESGALHRVLDWIQGEVSSSQGAQQNDIDLDEMALVVRSMAANVTTYLVNDPEARAQINSLMRQIDELNKKTEKTAADLEQLNRQMDEVVLAGEKARGWTSVLQRDVNEAIRYYNKTAKVAAETERTKVRKALIEQLRSENTKKLIQQQEKYQQMMRDDKKARELAEDNMALRRQINTVIARIGSRLFAETDQKNIPEEAKPLARLMMEMLLKHDEIYRNVLYFDKKARTDAAQRLLKMTAANGAFDPDTDLEFLVIKAPNAEDNDTSVRDKVMKDLMDIESGLVEYRTAEGQGRISLQDRKNALDKIQEAVSEIYTVIQRRGEAFIAGKRYEVSTLAEQMENEMANSRFRGERYGKRGVVENGLIKAVGYGNLTPEYFFKMIRNGVLKILHGGFHDAEQRAGLEALNAKTRIDQIAKETGYDTWDGQEKHMVKVTGGREIEMTTEQIMALYATWLREKNQLRPEETAHLLHGGFVLAPKDRTQGWYAREKNQTRPIRMNEDLLNALGGYLTDQQREYVERIVEYMSGELAELGNETSMQTYGIKKFTESFYFPIKSWEGVLSKSSNAGIVSKSDNKAMRQSFSKRIRANASNAIEIGDFTKTAMNHIVGMITYNTVGPAVENLNRVLNFQLNYGEAQYNEEGEIDEDDRYKMSVEAAFRNAYGENAANYLRRFMQDINGGMTRQTDKSIQDKLLSIFRKSAVAGSLSVAAQQPLSYIRAATMINPIYLARAIAPTHWGKIHDEMLKYSGVAVIKDMGRFDMNQGQSMIDFITPEGKISKARKEGQKAIEATTILPEKMDGLTWGRMWVACKLETAAKNPGMDQQSDEFLQKVAERFNDVMRKTQVYDSMLVKSQNMRSTNIGIKAMTSFMAEPTLSLNVLADAVMNAREKGGMAMVGKAASTFAVSAVLQALVKALMSSGRSPDKKKRLGEQFLIKWASMSMSEVNPLALIPGYSDLIEVFKNGELADDAWSALGKLKSIVVTGIKGVTGKSTDHYRNLEDTLGQLAQLFTNVPAKNLMRDARAIYNWFNPDTYANREHSAAVVKYGIKDAFFNADSLVGLANSYLGIADAGYGTATKDYYNRIYNAEKAGNEKAAEEMKEYVTLTSKAEDPVKQLNSNLITLAKEDKGLSYSEKIKALRERNVDNNKIASWILDEYKENKINKEEAKKLWLEADPKKDTNDAYFKFEQADWEEKTGENVTDSDWFRLNDAIGGSDADYNSAVRELKEHGYKEDKILDHVKSRITDQYKDGKATKQQTEAMLKKYRKDMTADDIWWALDLADYKKETGDTEASGNYYRLYAAIKNNKSDEIKAAVDLMVKHGMEKKNMKGAITNKYKQAYFDATGAERTRLEDALTKAYKAIGLTAQEALKIIRGWKQKKNS